MMTRLLFVLLAVGLAWGNGGVQAQPPTLEIRLASPGAGETFYIAPNGYLTSVPIAGQIISHGAPLAPETIELTLQLINDAGVMVEAMPTLNELGFFETWATITAADALSPVIEVHEADLCPQCHRHGEFDLPSGVSQVILHARAADGRTASATRELRLDRGQFRNLTVLVNGLPPEAAGARVMATTRLYDWRRRTAFGEVAGETAAVQIETLSYNDLMYEVSLLPLVWQGVRYTTPVVTLPVSAGAGDEPLVVSLTAQASLGAISGRVVAGLSRQGMAASLLAVRLDSGAAYTAQTNSADGAFAFADLPLADYLLLARAAGGFHLPQHLDLTTAPPDDLTLHLTAAGDTVLRGRVLINGQPHPFAQITAAGLPTAYADPFSGVAEIDAVDLTAAPLEVAAAGCYGVRFDSLKADMGDMNLMLRSDTRVLTQGGTRLYLPAASRITDTGGVYTLADGVLWAASEGEPVPVVVQVGDFRLEGRGSFAVEKLPNALPRLYVSAGEVEARQGEMVMTVAAGQLLTLTNAQPVQAAPGVGALLRLAGGSAARFELAPSPSQMAEAQFKQVIVLGAQVTVGLAMVISLLALPLMALVVVGLLLRRARH